MTGQTIYVVMPQAARRTTMGYAGQQGRQSRVEADLAVEELITAGFGAS